MDSVLHLTTDRDAFAGHIIEILLLVENTHFSIFSRNMLLSIDIVKENHSLCEIIVADANVVISDCCMGNQLGVYAHHMKA